jgi:hypothetical protein
MKKLNDVMYNVEQVDVDLFTVSSDDFNWLIKQAEKVAELKDKVYHYEMMYDNTGAMFNRMTMKEKIEEQQKEIDLRKRYESFLKSVIRSGETIKDEEDFEWFCNRTK